MGNLLGALSTAQTNAGILAQRAGENPRVSGALSFIQNQSTGVLGKFGWGGKKEEKSGGGEVGGGGGWGGVIVHTPDFRGECE